MRKTEETGPPKGFQYHSKRLDGKYRMCEKEEELGTL
jgi:hypothetical protein